MFQFRNLYILTVGITTFYLTSINKYENNPFKVSALKWSDNQSYTNERPSISSDVGRYGLPTRDIILDYDDFQISYDCQKRVPNWVLEHITQARLKTSVIDDKTRDECKPFNDNRISKTFQTSLVDYKNTEFLPGQLSEQEYHNKTKDGFTDTFALSTMAPQAFGLSSGIWDDFSKFFAYLTCKYKNVYVFSGPIFYPKSRHEMKYEVIGSNRISVPTHFFKFVIAEDDCGSLHAAAYAIRNEFIPIEKPFSKFRIKVSVLEHVMGLKFFKHIKYRPYVEDIEDIDDFRLRKVEYLISANLYDVFY